MSVIARCVLAGCAATALVAALGCGSDDVTAVHNRAPVIEAVEDTTIALGDTLGLTVSAVDPDGDDIVLTLAVSVTWEELRDGYRADARLDPESGYFWFRPKPDDIPSRTFLAMADDGRGGEAEAAFTVYVTSVRLWDPALPHGSAGR